MVAETAAIRAIAGSSAGPPASTSVLPLPGAAAGKRIPSLSWHGQFSRMEILLPR
jgi:hypothetical protein